MVPQVGFQETGICSNSQAGVQGQESSTLLLQMSALSLHQFQQASTEGWKIKPFLLPARIGIKNKSIKKAPKEEAFSLFAETIQTWINSHQFGLNIWLKSSPVYLFLIDFSASSNFYPFMCLYHPPSSPVPRCFQPAGTFQLKLWDFKWPYRNTWNGVDQL